MGCPVCFDFSPSFDLFNTTPRQTVPEFPLQERRRTGESVLLSCSRPFSDGGLSRKSPLLLPDAAFFDGRTKVTLTKKAEGAFSPPFPLWSLMDALVTPERMLSRLQKFDPPPLKLLFYVFLRLMMVLLGFFAVF